MNDINMRLVRAIGALGSENVITSEQTACVWGSEEVPEMPEISYTEQQIVTAAKENETGGTNWMLFSLTGQSIREMVFSTAGNDLFYRPGQGIRRISAHEQSSFLERSIDSGESWTEAISPARYILINTMPVMQGMTWEGQQRRIKARAPRASLRDMVEAMIIAYKCCGIRLLEKTAHWSEQENRSPEQRVWVGCFGIQGICMNTESVDISEPYIGVCLMIN